jgi:hypothetical protein
MLQTARDAAEALFNAIPHAPAAGVLDDYGIQATAEQMQLITLELMSLSLFRIHWALSAVMSPRHRQVVLDALRQRIREGWSTDLGLDGRDPEEFFAHAEECDAMYSRAMQEGAGSMDMANETAALLVTNSAWPPEDRPKLFAFILDHVPDEDLVALAEEIRLAGC